MTLLAAACSFDTPDFTPPNIVPRLESFTKNSLEFGQGAQPDTAVRPLTAADFINPDGQCAAAPTAPAASAPPNASPDAAPAPILGGIALEMSECDVVRRAGQPDRFEFGTTDRGGRAVTLTYVNGPRPGIYRFAGGRLNSIEGSPQAPPPAKPAKKPAAKRPPPA